MDPFSFLNSIHPQQLDELYQKYLKYPDSIEPSWRAFFQGFDFGKDVTEDLHDTKDSTDQEINFLDNGHIKPSDDILKEFQVIRLIDGYRTRGHLFTKTNPVRERRKYSPTLDIENFGLSTSDLDQEFNAGELIGIGKASLRRIIEFLESVFCDAIGIEYVYIRQPEIVSWIQDHIYKNENQPKFSKDEKKHILKKLNQAVTFEDFLHKNFIGQKRFSLEGNESLIPALDTLIEGAADKGVKEFVMGMAHRGRLNTLANIFGKDPKEIFNEFEGKDYEQEVFDGDVKYHLGWTCIRKTDTGKDINLTIAPNPSHLETVGAVVQGIARAKQDDHHKGSEENVLPIVVHGDAAIAGQGIAYEIVQMASLEGYRTQGTIHIVVNNQIGFTTNYLDGRSSTYCTDVGKVTLSPVFHVNADDAEAVVHAALFALEFRMRFKRDVFIDLLGYRKYGHNEGDEPKFTQPLLYKAIAKHKNPRDIYAERLMKEGVVDESYVKHIEASYKEQLEEKLEDSRKQDKTEITAFMQEEWQGFNRVTEVAMMAEVDTTVPKETLKEVAKTISTLPKDKKFIRKIQRLVESRQTMFDEDKLDWSMAEHLAYGWK
jgi:2-oxoglutarate dehydrogenase E1 component